MTKVKTFNERLKKSIIKHETQLLNEHNTKRSKAFKFMQIAR